MQDCSGKGRFCLMPICWLVNRCWSVSDYDDSFEQSNDRVVGGSDSDKGSEFFGELFDHFFATFKKFRSKFANTDMENEIIMLKKS